MKSINNTKPKNNISNDHETKTWTGITCNKIPCHMCKSPCKCHIVKDAKIFWSYVKAATKL